MSAKRKEFNLPIQSLGPKIGLFVNIRTGTLEFAKSEQNNGRISISNVKFLQNLATKVCEVKRFGGMKEGRAAQAHLEWGWLLPRE